MTAYYNEIDPFAAEWLRWLINAGEIAPGYVDERDIRDVKPSDLMGYTQCHFFAGIGVWSKALRDAGWQDDRPVWTASCPCQPFSSAGRKGGIADERHLWPHVFYLWRQLRPVTTFGEQVASKDGLAWLDIVQTDLERAGATVGAVDTCAAGFGAPHIRQRTYWVADDQRNRSQRGIPRRSDTEREIVNRLAGRGDATERVADDDHNGRGTFALAGFRDEEHNVEPRGSNGGVANAYMPGEYKRASGGEQSLRLVGSEVGQSRGIPRDSFWHNSDWLLCRDPKGARWRPVEPGAFPLAHGAAARMGRLRGYGNAIVKPQAEEFIRSYMECIS